MFTLNGVRNGAGKGAPVLNGGKYATINGNRPYEYDKWRMIWNGNHLAPPEPGSVLYFPGYPGTGTTIHDFSYKFADSAIDTDEALDATETGIDCDADATTAIPANSIIIIESEWCYVTATGTTITVIRGYHGTTAATHATNQDIWVWIPNNGTISGAVWKQLPSGLGYLDFDGSDDSVNCGNITTLHALSSITVGCVARVDQVTADGYIFGKGPIAAAGLNWVLFQDDVGGVSARTDTFSFLVSNNTLITRAEGSTGKAVVGSWVRLVATWKQTPESVKLYVNGALDQSDTALNGVAMNDAAANLILGESSSGANDFDGGIALAFAIPSVVWTAAQVAAWDAKIRSLF